MIFLQGQHHKSAIDHPGHQSDPMSSHPGPQPPQGPSLLHALQHRGGPLANFSRAPPDQHNPGGGGEHPTCHRRGQGLERTHGGAHSHSGRGNSQPQPQPPSPQWQPDA